MATLTITVNLPTVTEEQAEEAMYAAVRSLPDEVPTEWDWSITGDYDDV